MKEFLKAKGKNAFCLSYFSMVPLAIILNSKIVELQIEYRLVVNNLRSEHKTYMSYIFMFLCLEPLQRREHQV